MREPVEFHLCILLELRPQELMGTLAKSRNRWDRAGSVKESPLEQEFHFPDFHSAANYHFAIEFRCRSIRAAAR